VSAGLAEGTIRRPYSIACSPAQAREAGALELLVQIDDHTPPDPHLERARAGTLISVEGPISSFGLPDPLRERHLLFIAGGTGISPLRSMIQQAVLTNMGLRMRLLYSARTPADFSYLRELRRMERARQIELRLTASREWSTRWGGGRGRITAEHLTPLVDDPATLCFVCGPTAMVEDVPVILQTLGIAKSRIRLEEWM